MYVLAAPNNTFYRAPNGRIDALLQRHSFVVRMLLCLLHPVSQRRHSKAMFQAIRFSW